MSEQHSCEIRHRLRHFPGTLGTYRSLPRRTETALFSVKHYIPQADKLKDPVGCQQPDSQLDALGHQRVFSVDVPGVIKGYQFLPDPPEHVFTPVLDKTALGILRTASRPPLLLTDRRPPVGLQPWG